MSELIEWESDDSSPKIEWEDEPQPKKGTQTPAPQGPSGIKGAFGNVFASLRSDIRFRMNYDSSKLHLAGPFKKPKTNFRYDGDLTVDKYCILGLAGIVKEKERPQNSIAGNFEIGRKNKGRKKAAEIHSNLTVGRKLIVHGDLTGHGTIISGDTTVEGDARMRDLTAVGSIYARSIRTDRELKSERGSISAETSIISEGDIKAGHTLEVRSGDIYCKGSCDAIEVRAPNGSITVGSFSLYNAVKDGKLYARRPKIRKLIAGSKWSPGRILIYDDSSYKAIMNAYNMGEMKLIGEVTKVG